MASEIQNPFDGEEDHPLGDAFSIEGQGFTQMPEVLACVGTPDWKRMG